MARSCFAGPSTAQMIPKGAVSEKCDRLQSNEGVLSQNKIAVNDFAAAHLMTPTQANHSDPESNRSASCVTRFSLPLKEPDTQPTKEAIDASASLAKLIRQYSKPKDTQMTATSEATPSKPVGLMDTLPPSRAPRRAPIAQMIPLPPNAAVTTTPAVTAISETSTASGCGSCPSPMGMVNPQTSFAATDSPFSPSPSKSRNPDITLTPAPAAASGAFKDTALASVVQNVKFLSPVEQQRNGAQKRQHVRTSSPPKTVSTPESVAEAKRGRGRPRTRLEEQPFQEERQQRCPVQPSTPLPQTAHSNQSNPSLFAPSAFPLQQQQQQAVVSNINGALRPAFCSEEPRLWPGRGGYVISLQYFHSRPEITHSDPVKACANHVAHQGPHKPHDHGVCTTCRHGALRHIRVTRPELLLPAWWPLCKDCGDKELRHTDPDQRGCSCGKDWLCFSCQTHELEMRRMKHDVEAAVRRRTYVGEGPTEEDVETVLMGWECECGRQIGPNSTLMRCIGCQGILVGELDSQRYVARESALTKTTFAWT